MALKLISLLWSSKVTGTYRPSYGSSIPATGKQLCRHFNGNADGQVICSFFKAMAFK